MNEPWKPVDYEAVDITALQALERGEADEAQQKLALRWIIEQACGTYQDTFHRIQNDSDFAQGKRFVGLSIVKMFKLNPGKIVQIDQTRRKDNV